MLELSQSSSLFRVITELLVQQVPLMSGLSYSVHHIVCRLRIQTTDEIRTNVNVCFIDRIYIFIQGKVQRRQGTQQGFIR